MASVSGLYSDRANIFRKSISQDLNSYTAGDHVWCPGDSQRGGDALEYPETPSSHARYPEISTLEAPGSDALEYPETPSSHARYPEISTREPLACGAISLTPQVTWRKIFSKFSSLHPSLLAARQTYPQGPMLLFNPSPLRQGRGTPPTPGILPSAAITPSPLTPAEPLTALPCPSLTCLFS